MKKLLAAAALGAAPISGSLLGAGTANASTSTFLNRIHEEGYSGQNGDASLLYNGRIVCKILDQGGTTHDATKQIYASTSMDWTASYDFVIIANYHLC